MGVARPEIDEATIDEVAEVLRSGWLIGGPRVRTFEMLLSDRFGGRPVRCVSACTSALLLALRVHDVGSGDEVLMPTLTFAACANVVEQAGARPVFVDSVPATGLIDLDAAEAAIGPRTRALMVVHLGGRPVDAERLAAIRDRHGLVVVEDAAHAIGAAWNGAPIGAHGNPTAFSFHATKNMTTIEGGALALADPRLAARAERLARHGFDYSAWDRHGSPGPADYDVYEPGFKLSMSDVAATIGIRQLDRLDGWIDRRARLAARYDELLSDLPVELEPPAESRSRHAHHLYAVRLEGDGAVARDSVIAHLRSREIGSSVHFRPLHRLRYYRECYDLTDDEFPTSASFSDRTLTLPLFPSMSERDQEDVALALSEALAA